MSEKAKRTEKGVPTPKGPFWAWIDIDGEGEKWHLAFLKAGDDGTKICYPMDDFEDYWYADDWDREAIRPIREPAALASTEPL